MKFKRAAKKARNVVDAKGTIQVLVTLKAENGNDTMKGNISKSARIKGAKVSEVWAAVEYALFGTRS